MGELAIYDGEKYAILQQDLSQVREIFETNVSLDGIDEFDLDRISIPGSGAAFWSVPDIEGEPEAVKELEGVVILHGDRRAYWSVDYDDSGGGSPPDCHSFDAKVGVGWRPGMPEGSKTEQVCKTCALAQWGSGSDDPNDNTQACSNRKLLFFMRKGDLVPLCIDLAPTSVKPFNRFMLRLAGRMVPCYGAILGLKLVQEDSRTGVKYSVVSPRLVARLSETDTEGMKAMADALRPIFLKTGIESTDNPNEGYSARRGGVGGESASEPTGAAASAATGAASEAEYDPSA